MKKKKGKKVWFDSIEGLWMDMKTETERGVIRLASK